MRALITLLTALLLFAACSTSRKAVEKEKVTIEQSASIQQTATTDETTTATLDQATLEEILQSLNVTYDWERWEFDTGAPRETGGQASSLPASRDKEATADKPPNTGRPSSVTKGSLKLNSEGSQSKATQTSAGSQTQKADSIDTKAAAEKKEQSRQEKNEKTQAKKSPVPFIAFLVILIAVGFYFFGRNRLNKP